MSTIVNASGPINSPLMIVGMGPEKDEVATGIPFAGASGRILNDALRVVGFAREKCRVTNVCNEFLPAGTSLFNMPSARLQSHLIRLENEIRESNPNCIYALGEEPMRLLTGKSGITKHSGSILPCTLVPGKKVVVAFHPAWIFRGQWKWLNIFQHIYTKRAVQESVSPKLEYPVRNSIIGPSFNQVLEYLDYGLRSDDVRYVSLDIETMYWKKPKKDQPGKMGHIGCIGIGYTPNEAMCIPFLTENGQHIWSLNEETLIWLKVAALLQSSKPKIAQNASFEWIYFWTHSIYPANLWIDTMLLHHCLYPDFGGTEDLFQKKKQTENPGHSLAFINSQYTRTPFYKDDGKNWDPKLGGIQQWWRYNTTDVMVTAECGEKMWREASARGLTDFYHRYYIKPFYHAVREEWDGLDIDIDMRASADIEAFKRENELQELIDKAVGRKLNVGSGQQMQEFLYKERGYQAKKKFDKKTGKSRATADKYAIEYFATKHQDEVLRWIMELKKVRDLRSDILNQKLDVEGKIHTHYKLGGTDGARWSSTGSILGTGTNLQNIPRDGIARKLFVAE